jgi:polygalacturonase
MTISKSTLSRRSFLAIALAPTLLGQTEKDPWAEVSAILDRIKPPKIPARDFKITQFGAVPNSASDSTDAIKRAIRACSEAGGGRVIVPAGEFLTGPIRLKTGVNLQLGDKAVLKINGKSLNETITH